MAAPSSKAAVAARAAGVPPAPEGDRDDADSRLDAALEATFPASDPIANTPETGIGLVTWPTAAETRGPEGPSSSRSADAAARPPSPDKAARD
jgi:hypothetical protein